MGQLLVRLRGLWRRSRRLSVCLAMCGAALPAAQAARAADPPVAASITGFVYDFPANSVTFIRLAPA